jgi:hypothetical protein
VRLTIKCAGIGQVNEDSIKQVADIGRLGALSSLRNEPVRGTQTSGQAADLAMPKSMTRRWVRATPMTFAENRLTGSMSIRILDKVGIVYSNPA